MKNPQAAAMRRELRRKVRAGDESAARLLPMPARGRTSGRNPATPVEREPERRNYRFVDGVGHCWNMAHPDCLACPELARDCFVFTWERLKAQVGS